MSETMYPFFDEDPCLSCPLYNECYDCCELSPFESCPYEDSYEDDFYEDEDGWY